MTDRELLELAAKAAGYKKYYAHYLGRDSFVTYDDDAYYSETKERRVVGEKTLDWNPLTDDGDALRLAVKLGLSLLPYPVYREDARHSVVVKQRRSGDTLRELNPTEALEMYNEDPFAATRRAIVRAAAEIGRSVA